MARTFTIAQLMLAGRQRGDAENDPHLPDSELLTYLSASVARLYNILVSSGLEYYQRGVATLTSTPNVATIALPSDFFGVLAVRSQIDATGQWQVPLRRLMIQEETKYPQTGLYADAYTVSGSNLYLFPAPTTAQTYQLIYIPQITDLATVGYLSGLVSEIIQSGPVMFPLTGTLDASMVGANVTITGSTNFSGTWPVVSVTPGGAGVGNMGFSGGNHATENPPPAGCAWSCYSSATYGAFPLNLGWAGWEEYVVEDVARKCKVKSQDDTSPHESQIALLRADIKQEALNRELATPRHIVLTEHEGIDTDHNRIWPYYRPWGV